jgi:hypothetical protein
VVSAAEVLILFLLHRFFVDIYSLLKCASYFELRVLLAILLLLVMSEGCDAALEA